MVRTLEESFNSLGRLTARDYCVVVTFCTTLAFYQIVPKMVRFVSVC